MRASRLARRCAGGSTAAALPEKMRAILVPEYGDASVLRIADDVPIPQLGAHDVLVRVSAAGVNPLDCRVRASFPRARGRVLTKREGSRRLRALHIRQAAADHPWQGVQARGPSFFRRGRPRRR